MYEYINGAAPSYLDYGFVSLSLQGYKNQRKQSIDVEIYRMSGNNNGFGIYAKEKLSKSKFLPIGAEGYYEKGYLNFCKGDHYVKMKSTRLGPQAGDILPKVAEEIARQLAGKSALPSILKAFPTTGLVANSERYIAKEFLGHGFLHSAFVAEYNFGQENHARAFIILDSGAAGSKSMIHAYLKWLGEKGAKVNKTDGYYQLEDPYQGRLFLRQEGGNLFGILDTDLAHAQQFLKQVASNLEQLKN